MRLFLAQFLEMAHMALTRPEDLAMYLQRVETGNRQIVLFLGLVALSNATALYHIRSSYDAGYLFFLPFVAILCFVLMASWAFLTGAGIDALVRLNFPNKGVRSKNTIRMAALSLAPFVFVLPVAVPARIFSFPNLFLFILSSLLVLWHFVILYRSIQYHYELEKKEALRNVTLMLFLLFLFPFAMTGFALIEITALMGG